MKTLSISGPSANLHAKAHANKLIKNPHDAGFDVYPASIHKEIAYQNGLTEIWVDTGLLASFPVGTYGRLTSRSSTIGKFQGLATVVEGVIDSGYTGPIFVRVHTLHANRVRADILDFIEKGVSFAQLIPQVVMSPLELTPVESLESSGRGSNGFGSTDTRLPATIARCAECGRFATEVDLAVGRGNPCKISN